LQGSAAQNGIHASQQSDQSSYYFLVDPHIKLPVVAWQNGSCKPSATSSEETLLHSLQVAVTRELGNQHK